MLDYFTIGVILSVLALITYEDFRQGKIYNKRVLQILMIGALYYFINFLIFSVGYFKVFTINLSYTGLSSFFFALTSFGISLIISYALWYFRLWSAGDAKLFSALSFSIPISFYTGGIIKTFPALPLLVNVFFPLFFLILLRFLYFPLEYCKFALKYPGLIRKNIAIFLNNLTLNAKKNWRKELKSFSGFVLIFTLYRIIRLYFHNYWGSFDLNSYTFVLGLLALILIYHHIRNFILNKIPLYLFLLALIIAHFTYIYLFSLADFYREIKIIFFWGTLFLLAFSLLLQFYRAYVRFMELQPVKISELQPGMLLDNSIAHQIGFEELKNYLLEIDTALDEEKIKNLQKLFTDYEKSIKKSVGVNLTPIDTIFVHKAMHFGIWFFIGVSTLIVLKTSIVDFLIKYSHSLAN